LISKQKIGNLSQEVAGFTKFSLQTPYMESDSRSPDAIKVCVLLRSGANMHELVGHTLTLDEGHYEIVDVRHVGGELVIYAESDLDAGRAPRLARAVFRYPDVARYVDRESANH